MSSRLSSAPHVILMFLAAVACSCSGDAPVGPDEEPSGALSIDLGDPTVTLTVGGTVQLDARVLGASGAAMPAPQVSWTSDNSLVASVTGTGLIEARSAGTTIVRAAVDGVKDSVAVTVRPALPASLTLKPFAVGITATHGLSPPDDSRFFVTTLDGRVLMSSAGGEPSLFLDLRTRVKGGAAGLYSIAFHPGFRTNGYFYLAFVDRSSSLRVERFTANGPTSADPGSAKLILQMDHPPPFDHFGGWIGFGEDGRLYVTSGDGGPGNSVSAQNPSSLLGKVLRIDVDGGDPYAIPAGNPFTSVAGARPEIWAKGLRNPWRATLHDGLMYVADVGEDDWEEINIASVASGGVNYGWPRMEGSGCFPASVAACDRTGLTMPALEYPLTGSGGQSAHPSGCSVTGGFVYEGSRIPGLAGHYLYGDFCAGWIRSFRYEGGRMEDRKEWFTQVGSVIAFGKDAAGEIYVMTLEGRIFRIEP